jgi:Arc/MetJ family transcription regulator
MKTTVEIDDNLIREAMKALKVSTKREAIETGLREIVRRKNLAALRKELGTFDLDLDLDELERLRGDG